jgi:hypothetical protein
MNTITFDTHKFVKQLQSKGVPEEQAEVFVETMLSIQNSITHNMITKPEAQQFKSELKNDLEALESRFENRLQKEIAPIRTNLAVVMWTQGLIILTVVVPALKQLLNL